MLNMLHWGRWRVSSKVSISCLEFHNEIKTDLALKIITIPVWPSVQHHTSLGRNMLFLLLHLTNTHTLLWTRGYQHLPTPPSIPPTGTSTPTRHFSIFTSSPSLPRWGVQISLTRNTTSGRPQQSLLSFSPFPCSFLSQGNMMLLYINKKPLKQHRLFFVWARRAVCN